MNKILFLFSAIILATGFYDFNIKDIDGNSIDMTQFKGKKILLVNTASASNYTSQYAALEQLYQKYKDSLIIIVFPSNSFGNEARSNPQIKDFITGTYHTHFIIAEKTIVAGDGQSALYSWITHIEQNTMMNDMVNNDFYKFLIDSSGKLVGAFVSSVDPMSDEIQNAITN